MSKNFDSWQMEMELFHFHLPRISTHGKWKWNSSSQHASLFTHSVDEIQRSRSLWRTSKEEQACFSLQRSASVQDHFVGLRRNAKGLPNKYYCRRRRAQEICRCFKRWRNKGNETNCRDITKTHGKTNFTPNEDMDLRILDEAFD